MSNDSKRKEENQKEPVLASNSPALSLSTRVPTTISSQGTESASPPPPQQTDIPDADSKPRVPTRDEIIKVNIRNWWFYGVVLSILAVLISIICDLIMGYNLSQIRFQRLPDLLLANFAVAVNLKSLIISDGDKVSFSDRDCYDKVSFVFMLFSLGIYASVYVVAERLSKFFSFGLICVSIAILLGSTIIGVRIEKEQ